MSPAGWSLCSMAKDAGTEGTTESSAGDESALGGTESDTDTAGRAGGGGAHTPGRDGSTPSSANGDGTKPDAKADEKKPDAKLEDITLKLVEGAKADDPSIQKFTALAKELGLKSEGAQKLYDLQAAFAAEQNKASLAAYEKEQAGFRDALKADKELGGANYDATVRDARGALKKFGTPELKSALRDFGLENHPEFVRLLARVGRADREDTNAGAVTNGTSRSTELSPEEHQRALYPTMFKE